MVCFITQGDHNNRRHHPVHIISSCMYVRYHTINSIQQCAECLPMEIPICLAWIWCHDIPCGPKWCFFESLVINTL